MRYVGIDIGVENIVTCTSNVAMPLLIKGSEMYNKVKGYSLFQERSDILRRVGKYSSKCMRKKRERRNAKLTEMTIDIANQCMAYIIDNGIDIVIVGYSANWEKSGRLGGKADSQLIVAFLYSIVKRLEKRCKRRGIKFVIESEEFTSRCSFIDDEVIAKHDEYMGVRKTRRDFITKDGIVINADVNASLNIAKKYLVSVDLWTEDLRDEFLSTIMGSKYVQVPLLVGGI